MPIKESLNELTTVIFCINVHSNHLFLYRTYISYVEKVEDYLTVFFMSSGWVVPKNDFFIFRFM